MTPGFEKKKGFHVLKGTMACPPLKIKPLHNLVELQTLLTSFLVDSLRKIFFFLIFFLKKSNFPPNFSKCPPALPAAGPIAESAKNAIF